jgi:hypothetical protein
MKSCYWALAVVLAAGIVACGMYGGAGRPGSPGGPPARGGDVLPAEDGAPLPVTRALTARLEAKDRVVQALLAGECTLLEAAARFRELDAQEPRVPAEKHPEVYSGDTEAERYCRAVLYWARSVIRSYSSGDELAEMSAAVRRLEDQLEGHRLCGTLTLPSPSRPVVLRTSLTVE